MWCYKIISHNSPITNAKLDTQISGYQLNCLDEPVFMVVPKPMQTQFGTHLRLESWCERFSMHVFWPVTRLKPLARKHRQNSWPRRPPWFGCARWWPWCFPHCWWKEPWWRSPGSRICGSSICPSPPHDEPSASEPHHALWNFTFRKANERNSTKHR